MVHKTIEEAAANLEAAATYIPARYIKGVQKAEWLTPAGSEQAETNYATGVGAAVAGKRRQAAIKRLSNNDWREPAVKKGGAIIGQRIKDAIPKWRTNFTPVLDAMNSAADGAPPRTTDFMANITNRLVPVVEAAKRAAGKL